MDARTPNDSRHDRRRRDGARRAARAAFDGHVAGQQAPLAELQGNRRGYVAFWVFMVLFVVTLFAEFLANDKPFLIRVDGKTFVPVLFTYPETAFGGEFETAADYRDPYLRKLIAEKGGSFYWPLIRFSYSTHNLNLPTPAPSPPTWMLTEEQCKVAAEKNRRQRLRRSRTQLARHRRSGPRRGGAADLRLPHLGAVRADAHDPVVDHRRRGRRGAGLFRRLDRSCCSSA